MKTLYFECAMGAAGNMLAAALLELHDNPSDFLNRLNNIGIPGVHITAQPSIKCGIHGTYLKVAIHGQEEDAHDHNHDHDHHEHSHDHDHEHDHAHDEHHHHHEHASYSGIEHLIGHLNVSGGVKKNALAVYRLIAEAESRAHRVPVDTIHFHEVGELDAVADIVGVCMLIEELSPDVIIASPVNTGSGHIRCSHGVLPVPAPATAFILHDVPMYSDGTKGELCTPTGAALLKHFVKEFFPMPILTVNKIGYGMGKKDFDKVNCVRAFIGQTAANNEEVVELVCNLDDMTPEAVSFAQGLLLEEGALDVWTTSIGMKKGRSALSLSCMCKSDEKEKMAQLIFKHTTTLGIRENIMRRYTLQREQKEVITKYGAVRIKTSSGFGVKKSKLEYEDIAKAARENGVSLHDVMQETLKGVDDF